jgi:uncharacterized protein (DUF2249 family)
MTHATTRTTIDVRDIAPFERHRIIFAAFDALDAGAALEIVNDHDPQPLHRQFMAEATGSFAWSYLQGGPEIWRVSIRKTAQPKGAGHCCGMCGGGA